MITGIRKYDSVQWILERSMTATQHQGKATIMAWIHSHVNDKNDLLLSSKDLHRAKELEKKSNTSNIQSIVVEISKKTNIKPKVFRLTSIGRRRVNICREKTDRFHKSCEQNNFFEEVRPNFKPQLPLISHDFSILYGTDAINLGMSGAIVNLPTSSNEKANLFKR